MIKNKCHNNIFEYDQNSRTFYFADENDYQWAKTVLKNVSLRHHLGDEPITPFNLFYCTNKRSLTLKGLTDDDAQKLINTFKVNGLEYKKFIYKINLSSEQEEDISEKTPLINTTRYGTPHF